ncbi:hypothetical protein [Streptomyces plumbiresistens]|uniref:hypothetical protein n=1 Tax=Streptomyces plumbiresistens TaxID=511811 RepID=UPI0031ECFCE3
MSANELSTALLVVAFLQATLVVLLPETLKPLAKRFFDSEARQTEKHEIDLPERDKDREHLLGFLFRLSSLASASVSTLAALISMEIVLVCFSGVAFTDDRSLIGWLSIILVVFFVFLIVMLMSKMARSDIWRVNPNSRQPASRKTKGEESRHVARGIYNARVSLRLYVHRMKTFKTLSPYKTAVWGAAILLTIFKAFL